MCRPVERVMGRLASFERWTWCDWRSRVKLRRAGTVQTVEYRHGLLGGRLARYARLARRQLKTQRVAYLFPIPRLHCAGGGHVRSIFMRLKAQVGTAESGSH